MTLEDLWRLTRRYWVLLTVAFLAGTALAQLYCMTRTPVYTATTVAYVVPKESKGDAESNSGTAYSGSLLAQQKAKAWVPLVTSTGTAQTAIKDLGLQVSPEQLASTVSAELAEDTPSITVSANAGTPRDAQRTADAIVRAVSSEAARIEGPTSGVVVKPIQNAQLPTSPSSPRPERILPLGALVGLMVGYLVALIRLRQDTRVRTQSDVEEHTGTSVLAVMPAARDLETQNRLAQGQGNFVTREALRQLRTNLRFVDIDHAPRTIVVTSARMGEGKSTIASNLARVLADSGQPVVLVDADLRRPALAGIFDLDPAVGLTQVLAGTAPLHEALQDSDRPHLLVLTAGQIPPNPSELLGSERMHQLLLDLREDHMVVLDAPPLLPVTDAALLTAHADGALLVVSALDTREEHLTRAISNVHRVGGRVLGAVLNRVNTSRLNRIVRGQDQYGYGAYGGYGGYGDYIQGASGTKRSKSASARNAGSQVTATQSSAAPEETTPPNERPRRHRRQQSGTRR